MKRAFPILFLCAALFAGCSSQPVTPPMPQGQSRVTSPQSTVQSLPVAKPSTITLAWDNPRYRLPGSHWVIVSTTNLSVPKASWTFRGAFETNHAEFPIGKQQEFFAAVIEKP